MIGLWWVAKKQSPEEFSRRWSVEAITFGFQNWDCLCLRLANPKDHHRRTPKILWDFRIQTDKQVRANQPDTVIENKDKKEATIIDIAIPNDVNIREKKT